MSAMKKFWDALMSGRFAPQSLPDSGLKVGRHHADMVGSARHSECRTLNHCSGIGGLSGESRENGQFPTTEEDRRCLQASLQTALESWRQE